MVSIGSIFGTNQFLTLFGRISCHLLDHDAFIRRALLINISRLQVLPLRVRSPSCVCWLVSISNKSWPVWEGSPLYHIAGTQRDSQLGERESGHFCLINSIEINERGSTSSSIRDMSITVDVKLGFRCNIWTDWFWYLKMLGRVIICCCIQNFRCFDYLKMLGNLLLFIIFPITKIWQSCI